MSLERGFLAISGPEGELGRVPLDDIEAVIVANPAASMTTQVVAALARRGAPLVISGPDFRPSAFVLPVDGHHDQGSRIEAQAEATLPVRKRLWAEIVKAKITAQAEALDRVGAGAGTVRTLATKVRSGDPDNFEALASQRYFPALFGRRFRRIRDAGSTNDLLNYGYTILRAATARSIVAAGLHPSLALHHRSKGDALRLADDLMEPFRPSVDLIVRDLTDEGIDRLDPIVKKRLAGVLHADFATAEGRTPLSNVLGRLAVTLAQVYTGERKTLALPKPLIPLEADEDAELCVP
ncbi:type II CRISPR-associated endonuclease Cas1 [Pinisolibacter sp.]|uniref:type II CRISPR-associated endonuclease Cas1 n=1 Tax=Pinisolibacter sp. TaxID=2172024 RepID=UPI002FDE2BC8